MQLQAHYKLREVSGEYYIVVPGRQAGDEGHVVAFSPTAVYLWNALWGRSFEVEDVTQLLVQHYQVDNATAQHDAQQWVNTLQTHGVIKP